MKITRNIISRDKAAAFSPTYVAFIKGKTRILDRSMNGILDGMNKFRRGQQVITTTHASGDRDEKEIVFVRAKVTRVNHNDLRASPTHRGTP